MPTSLTTDENAIKRDTFFPKEAKMEKIFTNFKFRKKPKIPLRARLRGMRDLSSKLSD